jgi:hypothetical protein
MYAVTPKRGLEHRTAPVGRCSIGVSDSVFQPPTISTHAQASIERPFGPFESLQRSDLMKSDAGGGARSPGWRRATEQSQSHDER